MPPANNPTYGTASRKELESLLARGLDEDQAVGLSIRGMIR